MKPKVPRPISIDRLREVLDFDPKTGLFHWKLRLSIRIQIGQQAGCVGNSSNGREYIFIGFDGESYLAHRLAWAHHHGVQPPAKIDHEDGDGRHNWIDNLREATQSQNLANMRKTIKSSTGYRGVYPHGNRFIAKACKNYKVEKFGVHDTPEAAYEAYCAGMKTLFGEFASVV